MINLKTQKIFFLFLIMLLSYFSIAWGADRGNINSGETKFGLDITDPTYMDKWTFNGSVGYRVIINAVTTSGGLYTLILLYPPGGGAKEADSYGSDQLDYQLKNTGLYNIVVEDSYLSYSGTYNISLTKIPCALRSGIYNPFPQNGGKICDSYSCGSLQWDRWG